MKETCTRVAFQDYDFRKDSRTYMTPLFRLAPLALLAAGSLASAAQTPLVVQPGAPGQPEKALTPAQDKPAARPPSEADISFMQGMIHHHNQAVEMTALIQSHTTNPEVRNIGNRISISQTDEMRFMKQWLGDHGVPLPAAHDSMAGMGMSGMEMSGMDHSKMAGMDHSQMAGMNTMNAMPAMPGMLTPAQMTALRAAKGAEFDHLFLTGMVQHHTGALTMVKDLLAHPGAAQDPVLFDFASDVDNTQLAEIDFMKAMLQKEKQ